MRVMVTGHRDVSAAIVPTLQALLTSLKGRTPGLAALSGMAIGTDLMFAEQAVELGIPLTAAWPFEAQSSIWPAHWQERHRRMMDAAAEVVKVWEIPGYGAESVSGHLLIRNQWLVDHSDFAIVVWNGAPRGGTYDAYRRVLKAGRKHIIVDALTGALRS
jgi:uncharacterized phage-like protein YoqJ